MKIRTDLTAFSLTGLCVVAMVTLVALGQPIPDLLSNVTLVSLGVGGGAALPTLGRVVDKGSAVEATPAAQLPAQAVVDAPAVYRATLPNATPGRDWTETIPKITPEMLAREAGR